MSSITIEARNFIEASKSVEKAMAFLDDLLGGADYVNITVNAHKNPVPKGLSVLGQGYIPQLNADTAAIRAKLDAAFVETDDKPIEGVEPAEALADAPQVQSEIPTKDELLALLNRYAGKTSHKAAKEAMAKYDGTRLSDISQGDWPSLASDLKAALGE